MNSSSQWERAQAAWRREAGARHGERTATQRYAAGHRQDMKKRQPHWEAVEDEPMPDYETGDATVNFD